MENYFNYYTEIEEHFQRRRGSLLILSPLDWVLMETWKDAGIPLRAVLRGIDTTFEKWERRPRKTRKVNGLAFCAQEAALGHFRCPRRFCSIVADAFRVRNGHRSRCSPGGWPNWGRMCRCRALVGTPVS